MKFHYYIVLAVLTSVYITDTKTMQALKFEAIDIVRIRRGENPERIAYEADLLTLNGKCIISGIKFKIDKEKRKAGSILCWKQTDKYSDPEEIDDCHFELLENEYKQRNDKKN